MRKHKWKLLGTALVVALTAAGAFVLWPEGPRATRENFRRIRQGMNKAEVQAILGAAWDQTTVETEWDPGLPQERVGSTQFFPEEREPDSPVFGPIRVWVPKPPGGSIECWDGDLVSIAVYYDKEGRVHSASCGGNTIIDHGALGNALWRTKRAWRRWIPPPPGPPTPTF